MRYDREDDVLMIWFAEGLQVDHAEHVGQTILHVTEKGEPILLELLNAHEFALEDVEPGEMWLLASGALKRMVDEIDDSWPPLDDWRAYLRDLT